MRRLSRIRVIVCAVVSLAALSVFSVPAFSGCAEIDTRQGVTDAGTISLSGGGGQVSLSGAAAAWNNACSGGGQPTVVVGTSGDVPVSVEYRPGNSTNNRGSCGSSQRQPNASGEIVSASIVLFENDATGNACNQTDTLAHEIGHVFGLSDVEDMACAGTIMGSAFGTQPRTITAEHCSVVDGRWTTPQETERPDTDPGGCATTVPATENHVLGVLGERRVGYRTLPGAESVFSRRFEVVDEMRYMMEDWALYGTAGRDRCPDSRLLSTSSHDLQQNVERRGSRCGAATYEGLQLLVVAPSHPYNRRHISPPEVSFAPLAVSVVGDEETLVLRIDVGEDRRIRKVESLYSSLGLAKRLTLKRQIVDSLRLEYASEKNHRVVVYAVFEIGHGQARLIDHAVIRPRCCCWPICY